MTSTLISTTLRPWSTLTPRWLFHTERSGNSGCGICWSAWTPIILWVSPGVHACHSHWLFLQVIVCGDVLMKMTNWCVWLLWAALRAETRCVWPSEEVHPDFSPDRVCISPCHLLIASSEADGGTDWGKWLFCSAGDNSQMAVWEAHTYCKRLSSDLFPREQIRGFKERRDCSDIHYQRAREFVWCRETSACVLQVNFTK